MSMPMATGNARERPMLIAELAGAAAGLVAWLVLRALRFDRITAIVRWLINARPRHASPSEIARTLRGIDAGARLVPVRVACLERSLAGVLLLAARRRGVTWQMGIRTPPLASHAWLSDPDGEPIGEASSTMQYRTILKISPRQQTGEARV
ncbi:lasso peptide biosynthesis B2 protein [Amycolatopsis rhizosphaerae]|uniref:Lasso peptide biosynthesis B2 protein n=1 Tax=Amycolatopsis rhizosphaerae TaxID=2053003 RepID=A0A558C4X8_9PSEU|nr:lasso peptide biosynthesis B2 protein [Amycolatopsis rhizosphaerae]TVT43829.1 lasso peptide biosynthesis B2 protein [Amycolatopsis rhizosphaerae]